VCDRSSAPGRNDSLANGSLRASNFQCRLSGDESEGSAVATRPEAALQVSPKRPDARTDFRPVLHLRRSRSQPSASPQKRTYAWSENRRVGDRSQTSRRLVPTGLLNAATLQGSPAILRCLSATDAECTSAARSSEFNEQATCVIQRIRESIERFDSRANL
jgi:hypothetical protein